MIRQLSCPLLLVVIAACQDAPTTAPGTPGPEFAISDGQSGGNPDFFIGPPVSDRYEDSPNYDPGASNGLLRPFVHVCETNGVEACTVSFPEVTSEVTGSAVGLLMSYNGGAEEYRVSFDTDLLDVAKDYRLEFWIAEFTAADRAAGLTNPQFLLGYRDIGFSPSRASCTSSDPFCLLRYGQNLRLAVRIEQFAACPTTMDCATQFVAVGQDATLGTDVAEFFIPGQQDTGFSLIFQACSGAEESAVAAFTVLRTYGPCFKTVAPPTVQATQLTLDPNGDPAKFSLCLSVAGLGIDPQHFEHVGVHHYSTGDNDGIDFVEAWPESTSNCPSGVASAESPRGFLQLAQAAGRRLLSLFAPEPLVALNLGAGGQGFKINSFYTFALPSSIDYVSAGDASQLVPAGSDVTLRGKVTDLDGDPVADVVVEWSVESPPGIPGATLSASAVSTDANGISEVTVTLPPEEGLTVVHASGHGLADGRFGSECTDPEGGSASCNGPRPGLDPFEPLQNVSVEDGVLVISEGTRLRFDIVGCIPGQPEPLNCNQ